MPTELVLLSETPPTVTALVRAAADLHPEGTLIDYRDGLIRQLLAADGQPLLQVYRSRPVIDAREAAAAVDDPPASFSHWTDLAVPYGDPAAGIAVASALAVVVGGMLTTRI